VLAELVARMAEIVASRKESDVLVAMGLGSCIGVALLDRASPVAGLAHVVLPEGRSGTAVPAKFADTAVPELIRQVSALGAAVEDHLLTFNPAQAAHRLGSSMAHCARSR